MRQEMTMSTITNFDDALDFYPAATTSTPRRRSILGWFRAVWDGVSEGLAASKRYQELTARGVPHEQAASKVFFEHYTKS
jgi:hypothetical protein